MLIDITQMGSHEDIVSWITTLTTNSTIWLEDSVIMQMTLSRSRQRKVLILKSGWSVSSQKTTRLYFICVFVFPMSPWNNQSQLSLTDGFIVSTSTGSGFLIGTGWTYTRQCLIRTLWPSFCCCPSKRWC